MALALVAGVGAAAFYGYRMYDYIEHDNEFCLTCHLMVDPYERFAQSAHRDLGCKSCHKPTLAARSKMALTQIIKNPEELQTHAEVPNEKCETCHVKGDPEKWKQVSATAGHRVHFESKDPKLKGLNCVECHSTSLHEFAAADKTCSQSGCHENTKIQLGKMANLTLHCAVCHEFTRPVAKTVATDSLHNSLTPKAEECLSCHAMRARVAEQFEGDDPHNAECGICHNPHEQRTPQQAVATCASSGCHSKPEQLTPMHRGISATAVADCVQCHTAHKFTVKSNQCIDCHQSIFNDAAASPGAVSSEAVSKYIHPVAAVQQAARASANQAFNHTRHRQVKCESCHNSTESHGAVVIKSAAQCQSCHHGNTAVAANCASCHQPGEYANRTYPMSQRFTFSTPSSGTRQRAVSFAHQPHSRVECTACHREPVTRSAAKVECNACHADHHKATASCMACHPTPRQAVHNRNVHLSCAGSGCHSELPKSIANVPRTRTFCLACHQNMVNHRPTGNCADCHRLPAPRAARAD